MVNLMINNKLIITRERERDGKKRKEGIEKMVVMMEGIVGHCRWGLWGLQVATLVNGGEERGGEQRWGRRQAGWDSVDPCLDWQCSTNCTHSQ